MKKIILYLKNTNPQIVLSILLAFTSLTLITIIILTGFDLFITSDALYGYYSYISIFSLATAIISGLSFVAYFTLIKKNKFNFFLLISTGVLFVLLISSGFLSNYIYNNQPTGPDYSEISAKYDKFLSENSKEESASRLVEWLNSQDDIKDAKIVENSTSGGKELFFTVKGLIRNSYDQTYPLDELESMGLYTDCIDSCPPEDTDNYDKCISACDSSLGGTE